MFVDIADTELMTRTLISRGNYIIININILIMYIYYTMIIHCFVHNLFIQID